MAGFQVSINGRFWVSTEASISSSKSRPVPIGELTQGSPGELSAVVRDRVLAARERQAARSIRLRVNATLTGAELKRVAPLDQPPAGDC